MTRELQKAVETALEADMIRAGKLGLALDRRWLRPDQFRNILVRDLTRASRREGGVELFPNVRAVLRTQENVLTLRQRRLGTGLGWVEALTGVLDSLVKAGGRYATARYEGKTMVRIQKIQAQTEMLHLKAAQMAADRARMELARSQAAAQATATGPSGAVPIYDAQGNVTMEKPESGLPGWLIPAAAIAVVGTTVVVAAS